MVAFLPALPPAEVHSPMIESPGLMMLALDHSVCAYWSSLSCTAASNPTGVMAIMLNVL